MSAATDRMEHGRQDLAAVLRRLREASGLTGDRLAVRVGMSQSKVSRIETGKVLPSLLDVERLLTALDVPPAARSEVLELARAANMSFVAWRTLRQTGLSRRQSQFAAVEQRAHLLRIFQPAVVPGLLQTPAYARAVLSLPRLSNSHDLSAAVAGRMERQALLYDESRSFRFIITEAVLRGRLLHGSAMFAQLEQIVTMSKLPNVEVGIVLLTAALSDVPSNAFVLLDDRVVLVETFAGEMVLREPRDIELHAEVFKTFDEVALWGDAGRRVVRGLLKES